MLYTPDQLQNLSTVVQKPDFLWEGIIPSRSKMVLLHGPGGVGKSALLWNLFNAIEQGQPFLGLPTRKAKTLIISTDMSVHELHMRWDVAFKPLFAMEIEVPFEIRHPNFFKSDLHDRVLQYVEDNNVELIGVDTIGKIHFGDPNKEDTVAEVYKRLTTWFKDRTIIGNFHNKKSMRDAAGGEIVTEDDFRGNRKWVDDAVVQLQMRRVPKAVFRSRLYHSKSQVAPLLDPIDCYIDAKGNIELWQDSKAKASIKQWGDILASMPPGTPVNALIQEYMNRYGGSRATAYRARSAYYAAHGGTPPPP